MIPLSNCTPVSDNHNNMIDRIGSRGPWSPLWSRPRSLLLYTVVTATTAREKKLKVVFLVRRFPGHEGRRGRRSPV